MQNNFIFIFGIGIILSGCQTTEPHKSQAQFEQERIKSQISSANAKTKACLDDAEKDKNFQRIYEEIFVKTETSPNKFTLLTNSEKPSNEQIEILKQSIPIIINCRRLMIDGLSGTPFQTVKLKSYNMADATYIKLIKGEISIGEANQERLKANAQSAIEWSNTWTDIDNRLRAMHNSEIEGMRQQAYSILPLLMQQQQNEQTRQQNLYQQQIQNIINNTPSTVRTNCTTYGNQTNCTSR